MLSIVIPTYNESENLSSLMRKVDDSIGEEVTYEIVVVDDDSPDGTWERAEELSNKYPIKAIKRTKEKGLATAVLRGMEEAKGDFILVMDADHQHPPNKIPELVSKLEDGSDIAIASRFTNEGNAEEFGLLRRIVSKGADLLARTLFRQVREITDVQSGYFAFKRKVIEKVDLDPTGYKILLEILVEGDYEEVSEVGYVFGERKAGETKFGIVTVIDYLHHVLSLSWRAGEVYRFLRFCLVGGLGTLVNLSLLFALTNLGLFYLASGALGIEAGLITNFILNKEWTFGDRKVSGAKYVMKSLAKDHLVRSGGIAINLLVLWILTSLVGLWYLFSQVIGIGIATLWNFGGNKWFTWEE